MRPAHIGRAAIPATTHQGGNTLWQRAAAVDDRPAPAGQPRDLPRDLPMAMQAARMQHSPMRLCAGPPDDPDITKDPIRDNYLHSNPYPNTAAPGQTQECEAGLDNYVAKQQVIGNEVGDQGTDVDETKRGDVQ